MTQAATNKKRAIVSAKTKNYYQLLSSFLFGLLLPLSFAPFHLPGAAILGIALFYTQISKQQNYCILYGLFFGLGYFGLGTSWIFISIRDYGHLNGFLASLITLLFLLYLSLFPACLVFVFKKLAFPGFSFFSCLLFSALWILFEYLRANLFGGFPWLLLGFGQFDAPSKYLLPIIGVLGVGFQTCFAATLLSTTMQLRENIPTPLPPCGHLLPGEKGIRKKFFGRHYYLGLIIFIILLLAPLLLKPINWAKESKESLSVGIIQANLSMRDKWDEELFWQLVEHYKNHTEALLGTSLIVMPESAFPLPADYLGDLLTDLHWQAKQKNSAILLGMPQTTAIDKNYYFNSLISLGKAKGSYLKQHLVPFGEYIPKAFRYLSNWLAIPDANLKPGKKNQPLIQIKHHPIATLICYELAYGELLRRQLPQAEWIVSISDDGWFGHSLAMYQQQQMAQVRSMETARYQVVANNDGLSSLINTRGDIVASLSAFSPGVLKTQLFPATGLTPWVYFSNIPILLFCLLIVLFSIRHRLINSI